MILNFIYEILLIIKYLLIEKFLWDNRLKLNIKINLILIIPTLFFLINGDDNKDIKITVIEYMLLFAIMILVIDNNVFSNIKHICMDFLLLSLLESSIFTCVRIAFGDRWSLAFISIIVNAIGIAIVLIFYAIKRIYIKNKVEVSIEDLSIHQLISVFLTLLIMSITFYLILDFVYKNRETKILGLIITGMIVVLELSTIILIFIILKISNGKIKIRNELEFESRYNKQQSEYFKLMLEKEEETKNFRHDINNNLYALSILLRDGKINSAKDYLNNITDELDVIQEMNYDVGNEIFNIVLNYYIHKMKDEIPSCRIVIIGKVANNIKMERIDICVVFSNLLKNVYEEFLRMDDVIEKHLDITIDSGKLFTKIIIMNTSNESSNHHNLISTKKTDCDKHGRGIKNVIKVIERQHGKIEFNNNNNTFIVQIILPLN